MKKKNGILPAILGGGVVTLAINALNIGVWSAANDLIINLGTRGYRVLQIGTAAVSVMACVLYIAFVISLILKAKKENPPPPREEKKQADGMLSATGKLSDEYVMQKLVNQGLTKWKCLEREVSDLTEQLILMNSYQESLTKLLANNSAQALSDTEDILERIEQQILGNVRKVLNFMEILGTDDKQTVSEYIRVSVQDNQKLLDATKDFLICVTGFLNDQGTNGDANLQMVEDFKAVLVGNIGEASSAGASQGNITLNL